eukprot:scaffold32353_cov51-Phaeocystis_antarctica.AAC.1
MPSPTHSSGQPSLHDVVSEYDVVASYPPDCAAAAATRRAVTVNLIIWPRRAKPRCESPHVVLYPTPLM